MEFLTTMSWGKNTFMFIKHKALRLMPNIYIAYLIAFVVRHLSGSKVHSITVDIMNSLGELSLTSLTGFFTLRGSYSYMNGPTWYLSAMLLAMAIIYPIMLKFKENFFYYIAPMGFIFLLGITYQNYDNFDQMVITWNGYFNSGLLRGLMGILGGAMVYQFVQYLQKKEYTLFMRVLFTVVECVMYLFVFLYMGFKEGSKHDWVIIIFFIVGVTISLANVSLSTNIIKGKVFEWLGELSFSLYLGHVYYRDVFTAESYIWYPIAAFSTALSIMYISKLMKLVWRKIKPTIKAIVFL